MQPILNSWPSLGTCLDCKRFPLCLEPCDSSPHPAEPSGIPADADPLDRLRSLLAVAAKGDRR